MANGKRAIESKLKLLVMSHKVCWQGASHVETDGGFAQQIQAIADLFERTFVVVPIENRVKGVSGSAFTHPRVTIVKTGLPLGRSWKRKLGVVLWFVRHFFSIMQCARKCDAIHTPIPSDIGTVGIFLAIVLRKRLFIRYCGNFSNRRTVAERLWHWLMRRLRPPRTVILATGGSVQPPDDKAPWISWIFASSLSREQIDSLSKRAGEKPYVPQAPRCVYAGRLEEGKGVELALGAMGPIRAVFPQASLTIIGDGSQKKRLSELAAKQESPVRFLGQIRRDDLLEEMLTAHIFVFPSHSEGFPKVVHEALACGLPVICRRVSVLPQLIDNSNGYSLEPLDEELISKAVRDLYEREEVYRTAVLAATSSAEPFSLESWKNAIASHLRESWGDLR